MPTAAQGAGSGAQNPNHLHADRRVRKKKNPAMVNPRQLGPKVPNPDPYQAAWGDSRTENIPEAHQPLPADPPRAFPLMTTPRGQGRAKRLPPKSHLGAQALLGAHGVQTRYARPFSAPGCVNPTVSKKRGPGCPTVIASRGACGGQAALRKVSSRHWECLIQQGRGWPGWSICPCLPWEPGGPELGSSSAQAGGLLPVLSAPGKWTACVHPGWEAEVWDLGTGLCPFPRSAPGTPGCRLAGCPSWDTRLLEQWIKPRGWSTLAAQPHTHRQPQTGARPEPPTSPTSRPWPRPHTALPQQAG